MFTTKRQRKRAGYFGDFIQTKGTTKMFDKIFEYIAFKLPSWCYQFSLTEWFVIVAIGYFFIAVQITGF